MSCEATRMGSHSEIPVLLLKTRSSPDDAYEEIFSTVTDDHGFEPVFVPVLDHRFQEDGMAQVRRLLRDKSMSSAQGSAYGGLIFTSQRAVEAFAALVEEGKGEDGWPHLQDVPVYSVGPATTRALSAIPQEPAGLNVFGEHTGNGEKLALFILDHYLALYRDRTTKPPLLFLVGEQRRDIIPKTLMDANLGPERRVQTDETVVYGTGVMQSFPSDFADVLTKTEDRPMRWVVVFSPTGCDAMLRSLHLLDEESGQTIKEKKEDRSTFIATIGPTTRDYLKRTFDFDADVCAEHPSPQGVKDGILNFLQQQRQPQKQ